MLHISNNFHTECCLPLPKTFGVCGGVFFSVTLSNICSGHTLALLLFPAYRGLTDALRFSHVHVHKTRLLAQPYHNLSV